MKKKARRAYDEGIEDALLTVTADGHLPADKACDYYLDLSTDVELPKSMSVLLRAQT